MKKSVLKFKTIAIAAMLAAPVFAAPTKEIGITAFAAESTAAGKPAKDYVVTADRLNVRCGAGTDYTVIGTLTKGLTVKVTAVQGEKGNRWAKIRFEGVTAYVARKHLAPAKTKQKPDK